MKELQHENVEALIDHLEKIRDEGTGVLNLPQVIHLLSLEIQSLKNESSNRNEDRFTSYLQKAYRLSTYFEKEQLRGGEDIRVMAMYFAILLNEKICLEVVFDKLKEQSMEFLRVLSLQQESPVSKFIQRYKKL